MKIVFLWHDSQKGPRPLKSSDKKLAETHGIVDQGGSICGEKMETIAKVQTRSISLKLAAVSIRWNGRLLPRRYCWGSYNPIRGCVLGRSYEKQTVGYNSIRGCVHLVAVKRNRWLVKNYTNYGQNHMSLNKMPPFY
ncbi:unnamed protein product [Penicillium roqueforti FM164]|uniref:Genomic scaffold, ProqFM164S02 n=1 Tax=Penicillium roqueforti (strain FM164) TaxID=1365484 RepID=W6Q9P0_PENRF|nr:unnamed protein product [Penicillium roqueforti FM164]